jgi:hypothetical protein
MKPESRPYSRGLDSALGLPLKGTKVEKPCSLAGPGHVALSSFAECCLLFHGCLPFLVFCFPCLEHCMGHISLLFFLFFGGSWV